MSFSNTKNALNAYGASSAKTEAAYASPHRLVQILFDTFLTKVATAKGQISRKDYEGKSEQITLAISIVAALKGALDLESGGEIAVNLDDLYGYISGRLIDANAKNDIQALDEVSGLIAQIKSAWDAMPEEIRMGNSNSAESNTDSLANS